MRRDVVALPLHPDERRALNELRRAGAYQTDQDVIRVALDVHARHFEVRLGPQTFALGRQLPLWEREDAR